MSSTTTKTPSLKTAKLDLPVFSPSLSSSAVLMSLDEKRVRRYKKEEKVLYSRRLTDLIQRSPRLAGGNTDGEKGLKDAAVKDKS